MYELEINLTPQPASRPKVTRYGVYYSKTHTQYVKDLKAIGYKTNKTSPEAIESLVRVDTVYLIPIPKSATKRLRESLEGQYCGKKIDLDNLDKMLWDEVLSKDFIVDDCQIVTGSHEKRWTTSETGKTICTITLL